MAFRREVLERVGGFVEGIGRIGRLPFGCEETEVSIRASAATGGTIMHIPDAAVEHRVSADRATWRYYMRRCWSEGVSKALVSRSVGSGPALASERDYVFRALPSGVWRELTRACRGEPAGLARLCAICAGLLITIAGYLFGRVGLSARKGRR